MLDLYTYQNENAFFEKMEIVMSNENVGKVIEYINNNIRFGSEVNALKVKQWINKNNIEQEDCHFIYQELKDLNINLFYPKIFIDYDLDKFVALNGEKQTIEIQLLEEWLSTHDCSEDVRIKIKTILEEANYVLIQKKELVSENKNDFSDFLDDLDDLEELDSLLESDEFADELKAYKEVVDKAYNIDYLKILSTGDLERQSEAMDKLVQANKRLVWKIVKRYQRASTCAFDTNDMYQAGQMGLMKAAEKFDVQRGLQFSTYATWWIRQAITRSIADFSTTIRLPVHKREELYKLVKLESEMSLNGIAEVPLEELAKEFGVSLTRLEELKMQQIMGNITSLDQPIGEADGSFLGDFVEDNVTPTPDVVVDKVFMREELDKLIDTVLDERSKRVIQLRFGLLDGTSHTLEEIGAEFGVTRERIRQIESKAIKRMRHPINCRNVEEFYHDY